MGKPSEQPYASLSRRGQLGRLRRLGRSALADYGVGPARLTPLRHEHNTTFRVETDGGPYVLRINRPGVHRPTTIASEMAWLTALRRDTELGVPEPIAALDGSPVVLASDPGVPDPRDCVLLRWLDGRFVDDRLMPWHLRQIGVLQARLQLHSVGWTPPAGFARPRVDTLTDAGKRDSIAGSAAASRRGEHPTREDADRGLRLVAGLMSAADAAVFATALEVVWTATRELAEQPSALGLIHGDLHYENVLFHRGMARAIDFDDCGWGFHLYDVAVTLWELESRSRYDAMRAALLDEYSRSRPLPVRYDSHLSAFAILRRMQILTWVLESREHAAFRDDWQRWARKELDGISVALDARD
jgi:Ser/Thr protein kinase RdoA (MazF antagonist)